MLIVSALSEGESIAVIIIHTMVACLKERDCYSRRFLHSTRYRLRSIRARLERAANDKGTFLSAFAPSSLQLASA